jgi:predicted ATPase/DNA-binding winged helix-turn-helix (wHTH) protein
MGDCEIDLARRELRVLGSPVPIGARAFEVIEVLARSAGALVTKDGLMNRVWPGAIVTENTLHVHIVAIRKALGPCRGLLKTVSRRGYRLLGRWTIRSQRKAASRVDPQTTRISADVPTGNLPMIVTQLIGCAAAARQVRDLVSAYRAVTLTGPGGIGKTTLAVKVAGCVAGEFADGAWLVELVSLSDPTLVPCALAQVLRLQLGGGDITAEAVARAIGSRSLLVILDNCEHVVDAVAQLAETLLKLCPRVTILTTSREVLRIQGETVYRVPPLEAPAPGQHTPDQILGHSATQLFVARAKGLGADFLLRSENMPAIAAICRHLDGIPLAIEFAAARAATLGIEAIAAGLDDRFALLTKGRRTALPRHRTLRAVLDWSYELLADPERILLQRLAIFSGGFSLAAARAVVNGGEISERSIAEGVADLFAKSLVTSDNTAGAGYFRLLETTRAYALARLTESGDLQALSRRHAEYYRGYLAAIDDEWRMRPVRLADVDDIRAALEWCFGRNGDLAIGVGLAAGAARAFLTMSLLPECYAWAKRAICALDDTTRGSPEEMHLQASLGVASMSMHGPSDAVRVAFSRSLALAEAHGHKLNQVGLLGMLSMFHTRDGDFKAALREARRSRNVAETGNSPAATALAHSILGRAFQFAGKFHNARMELEASFRYRSSEARAGEIHFGLDHHIVVGMALARNLWLQGHPAQAEDRVHRTIKDAVYRNHPASLGLVLAWAPGIFLWIGDLPRADQHADWLISHAETHSLGPYLTVGRGYKAALSVRRGEARSGIAILRRCLQQPHEMRYEILNTEFKLSLVQGLVALGQPDEGLTLIDETIDLIQVNGDRLHISEALRVKGNVLLSMSPHRAHDAEACFMQSMDWSRRQGARSWELRTAVDWAAMLAGQGQCEPARALLAPILRQFAPGRGTADLKAADRVLTTLR